MTKELLSTKIAFTSIVDAVTEAVRLSNVKVVYNYPGRPATNLVNKIREQIKEIDVQDYLPNEFVATAKAFGSSVAGCERSLVIFKDVGTNVACDHFYCLNHIGINRGLVFFISDDPSAWNSQNEEDSRGIYFNAGLPILEPNDPYSAYYSVLIAFELSEILRLPFFIRTTGRALKEKYKAEQNDYKKVKISFNENFVDIPFDAKNKWLSIFGTVEEDREELIQKQGKLKEYFNESGLNIIKNSDSKLGIVASGFPATQLELEGLLVKNISLLKLVTVFPLPENTILNFMRLKEKILVIDQGEPLLEILIRDLAHRHGFKIPILGKNNDCVRKIGEFRDDDLKISVQALETNIAPVFPKHKVISKASAFEEGSSYLIMLKCLREAVRKVNCRPLFCGDAGQSSRIPDTPGYEDLLHMETTMGSVISYLSGGIEAYKRKGEELPFKGIAYVGDSNFFHSAFPGICEAVSKDHPILMILVDNQGAVSTGKQPHLGMKINNEMKVLQIKNILQALGVSFLEEGSTSCKEDLTNKLTKGLKYEHFAVVIVHLE
ncbi:MAG: hypothetical protein HYY52_06415 [Candidatus Melainabacteria bacterium]|nr:hypothetical protein [Candidatus Melainabacteria bacterium]